MGTGRRLRAIFLLLLVGLSTLTDAARSSKAKDAVRLDNIQALTFQKDKSTSHRRVRPIPQLQCVGGSAKGLFEPETVRCKNSGSSYSTADIEWTCTASLPREFKLGSTEVVCEGYDSAEDDYILKGSCGLEYRLVLTEAGEQKYGKPNWWGGRSGGQHHASAQSRGSSGSNTLVSDSVASFIFWLIFASVVIFMIVKATSNSNQTNRRRRPRGYYGGGGGGGSGHDDCDDDPPPPYSRNSGAYRKSYARSTDQGWRPGFWTGAAAGAASGYFAGSRAQTRQQQRNSWFGGGGGSYNDPGESSSQGSYQSFGSARGSSPRHESTGFGGTRRR